MAGCADWVESAEYGEADGAHEAHVHQLAVAEAGGSVVHLDGGRGAEHAPGGGAGQEQPREVLQQPGQLLHLHTGGTDISVDNLIYAISTLT